MKNQGKENQLSSFNLKTKKTFLKKLGFRLFYALIFCTLAVFFIGGYVSWSLTHPVREAILTTPASAQLNYENISFRSRVDFLKLNGWLCKSEKNLKTVIFAHGYGRNRLQSDVPIMPIAKELVSVGYNVLFFDFRNSGESEGNLTSVGEFESRDLLGACDYVNSNKEISNNIVLFGFSMGAATSIVVAPSENNITNVIADSPFSDLESYVSTNLPVWSNLPAIPFTPVIMLELPIIEGITLKNVSPVNAVKNYNDIPLLLIHSAHDDKIPFENSLAIQKAYKKAVLYKTYNAKHLKSYSVDPKKYMKEVIMFLK